MKHLFYISLSVLFGVFLIIASCKKDPDPVACTSCQKVTEAKDYFAFKVGSWWVYEEETSLERDSVYVTESSIDPNSYNFNVRIFSTYQDFYYHYWPTYINNLSGCSEYSPVTKRCLFVSRSKYQIGNYIGEDYCFFINYYLGASKSDFNVCLTENKIIFEDIMDQYTLDQLIFGKTIKIHELCTFTENCQPTNHYFSKNVGLIRKELIDSNQVWNLVNYHIEP